MNFEVKIKNLQGNQTHGAKFSSEEQAQEWIELIKNENPCPWGKLERIEKVSQCSQEELDIALEIYPEESEEIEGEFIITKQSKAKLPQMFSVEIIDLSNENEATSIEAKWKAFRADRDIKLAACDFTQLADAPISSAEKTEYRNYRSYLRSCPSLHNNITIMTAQVSSFEEWKAGQL